MFPRHRPAAHRQRESVPPSVYAASLDLVVRVRLTPSISRTFWSTERAWPGAKVRMHVETRFVPDGTPVKLEIRSADPEVATVLHTITDGVIDDSRCIFEHTIDWDDDAIGAVLAATTRCGFCFVTTLDKYALTSTSGELYVPFEPFAP